MKIFFKLLLIGILMQCSFAYTMEPEAFKKERAEEHDLERFWLQVPGQYRVYLDMVGDLFHAGHINAIKHAIRAACMRFHCEPQDVYMIIGVNGDADCASYKRLPILNVDERCEEIAACRLVNQVIKNSPLVLTAEFLDQNHIDLVVHGDDFDPVKARLYYGVAMDRSIFQTIPYTKGISTSDIIRRILGRAEELSAQLATK